MIYVDDFEEELREEYGKIFDNIAYIRARKRKDRACEQENGKNGNSFVPDSSYKNRHKRYEEKTELRSDKTPAAAVQSTNRLKSSTVLEAMNTKHKTSSKSVGPEIERGKDANLSGESESQTFQSDSSLYDKVAQDLETVFNNYALMNSNPFSEGSMEGEKNPENSLDQFPNENCVEKKKRTPRDEIKYKIVHTKNDTLHIWTAYV